MSESTGVMILPAVEVSLAALALGDEDQDLATEARRLAAAIDQAGNDVTAIFELAPMMLKALEAIGGTPRSRANWKATGCVACGKPIPVARRRRAAMTCSAACSETYRQARLRNREHIRRATVSDITPADELEMRRKARKCPMCGIRLSVRLGLPNSKHLDHIIPLAAGGTHTHGNTRIICADCNLRRPKDGSDYTGPVTLWAQGEITVGRADGRHGNGNTNTATCRKGLHPWTPENIQVVGGKKRCKACDKGRQRKRNKQRARHQCKCGALYAAPGRTTMCPECTDKAARKAAELHATGLTWEQVAPLVGYESGTGAWYAAIRGGYCQSAPRPAPEPKAERRCRCGAPVPQGNRGANHSRCDDCVHAVALRAASLYAQGWTLRYIADELGYDSITSVSNLIKGTGIEVRRGRPSKLHASPSVVI